MVKGWTVFKKPSFILPVAVAAISVVIWSYVAYIAAIALVTYFYLHWRFGLQDLGFRTKGIKGDMIAILLVGLFAFLQAFAISNLYTISLIPAISATLFRLFANPASTVENVFYFGFVTERFGNRWSPYLIAPLIGLMYTIHELSNPEYWYEGVQFLYIFIGITLFAAIYLWRRNILVIWLSNGLQWFISRL